MFFLGRSVRRWKAFMACGLLFGLLICIVPRLAVGSETAPSLTRMTGQMLLVGFRGQSPEECTNVLADIRKRGLGASFCFVPTLSGKNAAIFLTLDRYAG